MDNPNDAFAWALLIHFGRNMWDEARCADHVRCDMGVWNEITDRMAKVGANMLCGGGIMNLSLPASTVYGDAEFEKTVILVETYFREGGIHLQLNHVSRETLVDAQRHPEKYPNLRVRVSGFSGYFVRMSKSIQDEIIARTVAAVR